MDLEQAFYMTKLKKCSFLLKKNFSVYRRFLTHSNSELLEEVFCLVWAELWGRTGWIKFGRWLWMLWSHPKKCHSTISGFCHRSQEYHFRDWNSFTGKKLAPGTKTSRFWRNKGDPPKTERPIPHAEKVIRQEDSLNDIWLNQWELEWPWGSMSE